MTRFILLILGAVLGLFTALVHTKADRLRMYAFVTDDCNGPPLGGNIDVKLEECMHIPGGAGSIRPLAHKEQKWVHEVNEDQTHCEVYTFSQYGCFKDYQDKSRDLPEYVADCIPATEHPILSVSFNCSDKAHEPKVVTKKTTYTEVGMATTWVSQGNSFVYVVGPTTYTRTSEIISTVDTKSSTTRTIFVDPTPPPVVEVTSTVTSIVMPAPPADSSMKTITLRDDLSLAITSSYLDDEPTKQEMYDETDDETEQDTQRLLARGKGKWKGPRKGVWMLHPWTLGLLCYECYAKSDSNTARFECRSGPANPVDCGEMPASPTITETVTVTPTVTVGFGESQHVLQKRKSWHRRVTFEHPWFSDSTMCADAEWEKRGKSKSEIRIQKPGSNMDKCNPENNDQLQDIGLRTKTVVIAAPASTVYTPVKTVIPSTSTTTITVLSKVTPPSTATVYRTPAPSPSLVPVETRFIKTWSTLAPHHADL